MKILDIGMGEFPWILREYGEERFLDAELPQKIIKETVYVGLNRKTDFVVKEIELEPSDHELLKEREHLIEGQLKTIIAEGECLPFDDCLFDVCILSDVISIPSFDSCDCEAGCGCGCLKCDCEDWALESDEDELDENKIDKTKEELCCGILYCGLSDENKIMIIDEAIRVLKPAGKLIVTIYRTADYADRSWRHLEKLQKKSSVVLKENIDKTWFNDMAGDIRGSIEKLFQKNF